MADGYISQIKLPNEETYDFRDRNLKVYTGSCSTAAGTAIKDVITDGTFTLEKGAVIFVNFSATNSAAVGNLKLKFNGEADTNAKPIKYLVNGNDPANIPGAGYLRANQTYMFQYDGTNWVAVLNYYTYSNNFASMVGHYNNILARKAITAESLIVGDSTGYEKVASGVTFDLAYPIVWCTANVAANASNYANMYLQHYDRNIATGAKSGFTSTANKVIYLIVTINGNIATIDSNIITDTIPSEDNDKVYISLGKLGAQSTGANYFFLYPVHPMFWYKNGAIREYNSRGINNITRSGTTFTATRDDGSTFTFTQQDNAGITSVTIGATSPVQSSTSTAQTGSSASTTISLADAYGDTKNPYGSKTKNYVLAAPSNANGAPSFRALVAADIPVTLTRAQLINTEQMSFTNWLPKYNSGTAIPSKTMALFADGLVITSPATSTDAAWIRVTGTSEADTVLEIATSDDAAKANSETIVVRQYNSSSAQHEAILLGKIGDVYGATSFPVQVSAPKFIGNLTGTADKATADADNNTISTTYLKKSGGQMAGPLTWKDSTALPQASSLSYVLGIDAFASGGTTKWIGIDNLRTSLGLSNALHFIGQATTALADGDTGTPTISGKTYSAKTAGDVVLGKDDGREYVWTGSAWEILGQDASTTYDSGAAATNTWISRIQQASDRTITVTTASLDTSGTWSGNAGTATKLSTNASNTTASFWRGDNNWSSTLTGSITISKAGECGLEVINSQATNPHKGFFGGGSSGNLGIYDRTYNKWIVYSDPNGNAVLNGNANTATTATNLSASPTITSGGTSTVNLSANTAYTLTVGGKSVVFKTPADNNTATATDDILEGSNSGTAITYKPYTTQQNKLSFDTSTVDPTLTDRLNLNGYLYATKLYSGSNEVLTIQTKSKGLSTAGWYRILDCTAYSMTFFITFYGGYNNQPPTPVTFLISHAYNTTKIEQIGRSANIGWIQQLRAVHHDTSKFYIDVYYAGNKGNTCAFEITPLDPNARSNITLIDFTVITDSITANASCETTLESHADIATTLQNTRTLWGQSFDGSANVTGNLVDVGNQIKLLSGQTELQFLTSDSGAANGKFGKLGLNTTYANVDFTNYILDVNGKTRIGALDGGQHVINGNVQLNAQSGSYNEGLRINRSTTGYANIYLGGTRSSALGNQTGGWWIGTLSTPADATSNGESITNTVFTISNNNTSDTLSIKGTRGATIGTNSGWAIRPRLAIGTTYDTNYALKVAGMSWLQGPLRIGNSDIAGTGTGQNGYASANSGSTNYITFYGVYGDNPGYFNHTYIGESIYGPKDTANEKSELLLFKGNDVNGTSGPDRIRLFANEIDIQVYTSTLYGTWDTIRATTGTQVANFKNGQVTITGNLVPEATNTRTLGTSSLKWSNVYATTFTGNLTGNVTGNVSGTAANVTGTIAVANGGTGAISAAAARANLGTWSLVSDSFNTLMPADGTTNAWVKIGKANTSYGLLPSQSGSAGSGHNYIGTSSWYWKYAYIDEIYGHLNGNADTATSAGKWTTARTLTIGNTGKSVDGSGNVSWSLAEIGAAPAIDGGYLPLSGGTLTGQLSKDNYILTPDKYFASADGTKVGAIKITLPVSWTATMMSMKIDIYNYDSDNAITYTVGGYNYTGSGGSWYNCSAQCSGFGGKSNLAVRFGHDGTKCCIIIGEVDTSWSYPKVLIRDIILGHSGTTLSSWITGWNIEWITTLPDNIDVTKTGVNITSNYPTKTGAGASGTWGINITGSAGSVAWSNVSGRPTNVSSFTNDAGYLTSYTETDPTVPAWAKAASKPSYTASEVGALASSTVVTNVAISADTTTNKNYALVFGTTPSDGTTPTGAKTEGLQKNIAKLYVNPSTGNIQATTFNGYTLAAASAKSVVTSIDSSTSLPTSNAVKTFVEGKGYVISSDITTAINALDGTITGTPSNTNTITAFSQTNGKVSATFAAIDFPVTSVAGLTDAISASALTEALGLSKALRFVGITTTDMTGGTATNHTYTGKPAGISDYTPVVGDVVINSTKQDEWVCTAVSGTTYTWERLGSDTSYKIVQSAVSDPTAASTTSTTFIDTISQNANGVISATKKTLPTASTSVAGIIKIGSNATDAMAGDTTVTNVAFTAATDNNEYPILLKNSTGSTTTAASAKFANTTNKMTTINPSTGMITAPSLTIASNAATAHLAFARAGWNYITMPNNDSSVISIGYGTQADNTTQRLVIYKTGTVRPGANGSQNLGDDTHKWNQVYGVNFYGTFNGTSTYSQGLAKWAIDNSDLNNFVSNGALRYSWEGGSNSIASKPTDVNAFGVIAMKTATNWTGQLLMSTDSEPGLYWRTNLTTETPSYGSWTPLANGNGGVYYGTCETAADVAAKVVVCKHYHTLKAGDIIVVTFDNSNTQAQPTLNVNNTGAVAVKMAYSGGIVDLGSTTQLSYTCTFIYNGANWLIINQQNAIQIATSSSQTNWRSILLSNSNDGDENFTPTANTLGRTYAAHNVKYQPSTGTLRAPIMKTPKVQIEYDHVNKAHIEWNDTDSSIDFIFD